MADCQDLLIDEATWQAIDDPKTAEHIARTLFVLKGKIDSGPDGAREASGAILVNIEAGCEPGRGCGEEKRKGKEAALVDNARLFVCVFVVKSYSS